MVRRLRKNRHRPNAIALEWGPTHIDVGLDPIYTSGAWGSDPINALNYFCGRDSKAMAKPWRSVWGHSLWLDDEAWATIEPHLPNIQPGARRVDDRRIINGIIHVLKSGCRWRNCSPNYGPLTRAYNRFNRWSGRNRWRRILKALAESQWITAAAAVAGSYMKGHRRTHGGTGEQRTKRSVFPEAASQRKSTQ